MSVLTLTRHTFRERTRLRREAEIIAAAQSLIRDRGYHAVSMDDLAEVVGISKATLYQHFPSKDELVRTMLAQQIDRLIVHLERAQHGPASPGARLATALTLVVEIRFGESGSDLGVDDTQLHRLFNERPEFAQRQQRLGELMAALIEQAKANGEIAAAVATPILIASFFALATSRHFQPLVDHGCLTVEDLAAQLQALFFQGAQPR